MLSAVFPVFSFTRMNRQINSLPTSKNNQARKEPIIPNTIAEAPVPTPLSSVSPTINPPFRICSPKRIEARTPTTSTTHPRTLKTPVTYARKRYFGCLVVFQGLCRARSILRQGGSNRNFRIGLPSKETTLWREGPTLPNREATLRNKGATPRNREAILRNNEPTL
jgi:hypothetical protein